MEGSENVQWLLLLFLLSNYGHAARGGHTRFHSFHLSFTFAAEVCVDGDRWNLWLRDEGKGHVRPGVLFPLMLIEAGADKYLRLLQSFDARSPRVKTAHKG